MDTDVPRMQSVKNLHAILAAMQKAAVPDAFGIDFLKDLGFTSSHDRSVIKLLKFLKMLDSSGKPQSNYREYMDHNKSKNVLAQCIVNAYDDLFKSHKEAQTKSATDLKGWFKTKTGVGEKTAEKMATTFKSLVSYADFTAAHTQIEKPETRHTPPPVEVSLPTQPSPTKAADINTASAIGLTYRIEVHLPDTTNVDTFRAIFKAIREELMT